MKKIAVVTDSSACFRKEFVERHEISVIPLRLHWDGKEFKDGIDITPAEFYGMLDHSETLPTTSQPSVQEFLDLFQKLASGYESIVVTLISSGISGAVGSALLAAKEFSEVPVLVIDSRSTSAALALLVRAIIQAIDEDKSLDEIESLADTIIANMETYFMVDTLEYLHKGGRIGGASRYLGAALNIKPILYFTAEGKIDALEKVRTKTKATNRIIDLAAKKTHGKKAKICVAHANCLQDAEHIRGRLFERIDCDEIEITELSPVIGAHVGSGTLGIGAYTLED